MSVLTFGQSQLSSSVSNKAHAIGSTEEDAQIEKIRESFLFPIFAEMSRTVRISRFFHIVQLFAEFLLCVAAFTFVDSVYIYPRENLGNNKLAHKLSYIVNFGLIDKVQNPINFNDEAYPCFLVILSYVILIDIIFYSIVIWYRRKRSFLKWQLVLAFVIFALLNQLMIIPTCSMIGYAALNVFETKSTLSIFFLVISILSAIVLSFHLYLYHIFSSFSPYLSQSPNAVWEPEFIMSIIFSIALTSLMAPLSNLFSDWFIILVIIVNIGVIFYQFYELWYFPCIQFYATYVLQAILLYRLTACIIAIINFFFHISANNSIFIPLVLMVISMFLFYFWDRIRSQNILKQMNYPPFEGSTDIDKRSQYENLSIRNFKETLMYLHIGVMFHADMIVDNSFMKYTIDKDPPLSIIFQIIQVSALFPYHQQFVSFLMNVVNRKSSGLRLHEHYLLYQISKIHIIRQSSVSKEANNEAFELVKMSNEIIEEIRGFWRDIQNAKTDISFASLRKLRKTSTVVDSAFFDAVEKYPNSLQIFDSYCNFLIEASGNYPQAVQTTRHMMAIEQGQNNLVDHAFQNFVNVYPNYLYNKVLDTNGKPVPKDLIQSSVNESFSVNSSTSLTESIDQQLDEIVGNIFEHGKLRMAMQSSVKKLKMRSLEIAQILSLLQFFISIVVVISMMLVFPSVEESPIALIKSNTIISSIVSSMQYCSMLCANRFLQFQFPFDLSFLYLTFLGISTDDLPNYPSFFHQPYIAIQEIKESMRSDLEKELTMITSSPKLHEVELNSFGTFTLTENTKLAIIGGSLPAISIGGIALSLRGALDYFTMSAEKVAAWGGKTPSDTALLFPLFELTLNSLMMSNKFAQIFSDVTLKGISECEDLELTIKIIVSIVVVISCVVIVAFRGYDVKILLDEIHFISELMRKVKPETIDHAMNPIYLPGGRGKDHPKKINANSVHSAHEFSVVKIAFPVLMIFNTLFALTIVVVASMTYVSSINFVKDAFGWSLSVADRYNGLMSTSIALVLDNTNIYSTNITNKPENLKKITDAMFSIGYGFDIDLIGKDDTLNSLYYTDRCHPNRTSYNLAKYIDCLSLCNEMSLALNNFQIMYSFPKGTKVLNTKEFSTLAFLIDKYIYRDLRNFQWKIVDFVQDRFAQMNYLVTVLSIVGIIEFIICFILEQVFIAYISSGFEAFKQLVLVLPPLEILMKNQILLDYIQGIDFLRNQVTMTAAQSIIHSTEKPTLSLSPTLIVQNVNEAVREITGYTPDQLLGQSINFIIPVPVDSKTGNLSPSLSPFYCRIQDMNEGAFETNTADVMTTCLSDNSAPIPVKASLVREVDEKNKTVGFTLVLREMKSEEILRQKMKAVKQKTQELIDALLPKHAVLALRGQKKKAIVFPLERAVVVFAEVIGFTEYVSSMSPKQFMSHMNTVFGAIEDVKKHYESIHLVRNDDGLLIYVGGKIGNQSEIQIKKEQENQPENQLENQIENQPENQKDNKAENQPENQIDNKAENKSANKSDNDKPDNNKSDNNKSDNNKSDNMSNKESKEAQKEMEMNLAEETIDFGLEIIKTIDYINEQIGIDLHVRFAAHFGKPLCECISDPSNPKLEIFSSNFKFVAGICDKGKADICQVTNSIFELIDDKTKYEFEESPIVLNISGQKEKVFSIKNKVASNYRHHNFVINEENVKQAPKAFEQQTKEKYGKEQNENDKIENVESLKNDDIEKSEDSNNIMIDGEMSQNNKFMFDSSQITVPST